MRIEINQFPSDPLGHLGNLRQELVKALQRADTNKDAAKLVASTLGFTGAQLRKIYKEDGIKSKAQEKRDAKSEKDKVSKPKSKPED